MFHIYFLNAFHIFSLVCFLIHSKSNRRTGGRTGELEFEPADSDTFREGQVRTAGSNRLSQPAEPLNR